MAIAASAGAAEWERLHVANIVAAPVRVGGDRRLGLKAIDTATGNPTLYYKVHVWQNHRPPPDPSAKEFVRQTRCCAGWERPSRKREIAEELISRTRRCACAQRRPKSHFLSPSSCAGTGAACTTATRRSGGQTRSTMTSSGSGKKAPGVVRHLVRRGLTPVAVGTSDNFGAVTGIHAKGSSAPAVATGCRRNAGIRRGPGTQPQHWC